MSRTTIQKGREGGGAAASHRTDHADRFRLWWYLPATPGERAAQAVVAVILAAALAMGLVMEPSPTGTGTHTLIGLPPCGMLLSTGKPCPTCGVTTSFALACHGRFVDATVNQPFGVVVFGCVVGGLALCVFSLATGRSWLPLAAVVPVSVAAAALGLLALMAWAYKWSIM